MSMSSNYRRNKAFIDKYRKELRAMLDDISEIDERVLNKAINFGAAYAKSNTPVVTGFMRRSWHVMPTKKTTQGIERELINTAEYASYVNYGHRQEVGRYVPAIGKRLVQPWVKGRFILEKAVNRVNKALVRYLKSEVERVNRKHAS